MPFTEASKMARKKTKLTEEQIRMQELAGLRPPRGTPSPPSEFLFPTVVHDTRRVQRLLDLEVARRVGVPHATTPIQGVVAVMVPEHWVGTRIDADWSAYFRIISQNGQPVIGEVRIFPNERPGAPAQAAGQWSAEALGVHAKVPRGGITSRLIKNKLKIPMIQDSARDLTAFAHVGPEDEQEPALATLRQEFAPPIAKKTKRGRIGQDDLFYVQLAAEYANLLASGNRKPVAAIATRRRLPRATVRDAIRQARQKGFLTEAFHGRPTGVLTPAAFEVLKQTPPPTNKGGSKHGKHLQKKMERQKRSRPRR